MKIVFMGTPELGVTIMEAVLAAGHEIAAAVCQPDRPRGRCLDPVPPPVKCCCARYGLPVLQPRALRDKTYARLQEIAPDLVVVAAYGHILPQAYLDLPPLGCVNIHASLLPAWRGAAPIQRAILAGQTVTGVTLMRMEAGLDCGPILAQRECAIDPEDTSDSLFDKLGRVGAELLVEKLPALAAGELVPVVQDEQRVSWAPPLTKEEGRIDWRRSGRELVDQIRGLHSWPGTFTQWRGGPLKLFPPVRFEPEAEAQPPGTIVATDPDGIWVACGDGRLLLSEVQAAGKRRLPAGEFVCGARVEVGGRVGE